MPDPLVVRTMKDDIAQLNATPKVAAVPIPKPVQQPVQPPPVRPVPPKVTLPIPSPTKVKEKEVIVAPKQQGGNVVRVLVYILLICCLFAGATYGYMWWRTKQPIENSTQQAQALSQLIPKDALAVIDYNLESDGKRSAVQQMWSDIQTFSSDSLDISDPKNLLAIPDVSHVYFVIMPENPTPFLLIQNTNGAEEFMSQQSKVQLIEKDGWYIAHPVSLDQYNSALLNGSITEDSALLGSDDISDYLIRYAMRGSFVAQQYQDGLASAIGLSRLNDLVFHITEPALDGALRASARIAGDPPGEGVANATSELLTHIPSDISFGRIGLNFAEDLKAIQEDSTRFDSTVLAQPAVRQFTALFTTPYAVFERKGSDGVRDIGLIVSLPATLKQKIATGEPVIEQALPALIPFIIGKMLGIQVVFNETVYNGVSLRYVNIAGQTQTLDYTVGDNFLLISSSREGMSTLVDVSIAGNQGLLSDEPWKSLGEKASDIIQNRAFIVGLLSNPAMRSVLPISSDLEQVPVITSSRKTSTGVEIQAVLLSQ